MSPTYAQAHPSSSLDLYAFVWVESIIRTGRLNGSRGWLIKELINPLRTSSVGLFMVNASVYFGLISRGFSGEADHPMFIDGLIPSQAFCIR